VRAGALPDHPVLNLGPDQRSNGFRGIGVIQIQEILLKVPGHVVEVRVVEYGLRYDTPRIGSSKAGNGAPVWLAPLAAAAAVLYLLFI
jgi:hypothetical protein